MQAALEAATFWREDAEAGAKETEMPACSSPGCRGVRPPLPPPERVHFTPIYCVFVKDHRHVKGFRFDFMHLHVSRFMLEMQKESDSTTLLVCISKLGLLVEQKALIFMKLRRKILSSMLLSLSFTCKIPVLMHFWVCRFREKEVILQKKHVECLLRAKHCARCWEPKICGHLRIMRCCWLREGLVHNYLLSVSCIV